MYDLIQGGGVDICLDVLIDVIRTLMEVRCLPPMQTVIKINSLSSIFLNNYKQSSLCSSPQILLWLLLPPTTACYFGD